MTAAVHLRGVVIAGALAALALALGFVTLAMNQTASKAAEPHRVLSLKARHKLAAAKKAPAAVATKPTTKAKSKATANSTARPTGKAKPTAKAKARPNAHVVAALQAGLPRSIATALGAHSVVVVQLTSAHDAVAEMAAAEAKAGAALAGAGYVAVSVDKDGGDASKLTRALGKLPSAPASLVYTRPATAAVTLTGFNDRTAVQQAVAQAAPAQADAEAAATAQWAAKADAICSAYASKAEAAGGSVLLAATNFQRVVELFRKQQVELEALKPPAAVAAKVRAANAKVDAALTALAATKAKTAMLVPERVLKGATSRMDEASATYATLGSSECGST